MNGFLKIAAFSAAMLTAGQTEAAALEIDVHNFTFDHKIARAVMNVKNNTGHQVSNVFIDCAFLNKNKRAVGIGRALIEAIPARGNAFDDAALVTSMDVQFVDCRVGQFTP